MSNPSMTHQPTLKFKHMHATRDSVDQDFIATNLPSGPGRKKRTSRRGSGWGGEEEA
jgi:hypothetical protein